VVQEVGRRNTLTWPVIANMVSTDSVCDSCVLCGSSTAVFRVIRAQLAVGEEKSQEQRVPYLV
jgi:hypothetical protein